jgi:uncharacterized damage-inducible protein DinB
MSDLSFNIGMNFSRYYQSRAEKLHALLAPLSDDQIWSRPYPYGNSIGHLLLHLTGNLSYYIGTQIVNTGYVRNRELEFTDQSAKPKATLLKAFDDVMVIVQDAIARQSAAEWTTSYTAKGMEDAGDRFTAFLRCGAHIDHHIGQIMYLCKEIETQAAQARPASARG